MSLQVHQKQNFIIGSIIILAGFSRMFIHEPNFTAMGAMALFTAANLKNKQWALVAPLMALLIGDLFFAFQSGGYYKEYLMSPDMIVNYGLFLVYGVFGLLIRNSQTIRSGAIKTILASIVFFLVSNFHVWMTGHAGMYTPNFSGLMQCYAAGIPFFKYTFLSDVLFTSAFFAVNAVLMHKPVKVS